MKKLMMALGACVCAAFGAMPVAAGTASAQVTVDFSRVTGPIKPVNGVGQPPILGLDGTNMFHYLKNAGIPYSRLHDVGGVFGANVFVDIPNLFRDFDADETKAESYDFFYTDLLLKALVENGVEPYFRLGVTIENAAGRGGKAYRIFPPKDYAKWARICEHVVRHYTEGWADGFRMKITHWEIWNEPENWDTIERNQMWKAPFSAYVRLYVVTARHLKEKFPHLMIGGYGSCGFYGVGSSWGRMSDSRVSFLMRCLPEFLEGIRRENAPLDFFSFHCYDMPRFLPAQIAHARKTLDSYGYAKTELSCNEWHPGGEPGSVRQAADIAAMLVAFQNGATADAEIYDAKCGRGEYSPLFNCLTCRPYKAYSVYLAFNELRKLGQAVAVTGSADACDGQGLWVVAATDGRGRQAVFVVNAEQTAQPLPEFFPGASVRVRAIDAERDFADMPSVGTIGGHTVLLIERNTGK